MFRIQLGEAARCFEQRTNDSDSVRLFRHQESTSASRPQSCFLVRAASARTLQAQRRHWPNRTRRKISILYAKNYFCGWLYFAVEQWQDWVCQFQREVNARVISCCQFRRFGARRFVIQKTSLSARKHFSVCAMSALCVQIRVLNVSKSTTSRQMVHICIDVLFDTHYPTSFDKTLFISVQ